MNQKCPGRNLQYIQNLENRVIDKFLIIQAVLRLQKFQMSITGSVAILAVLFLRLLLRRTPKIFSYALWIVVLFRFICPVALEGTFGIPQNLNHVVQENYANRVYLGTDEHTELKTESQNKQQMLGVNKMAPGCQMKLSRTDTASIENSSVLQEYKLTDEANSYMVFAVIFQDGQEVERNLIAAENITEVNRQGEREIALEYSNEDDNHAVTVSVSEGASSSFQTYYLKCWKFKNEYRNSLVSREIKGIFRTAAAAAGSTYSGCRACIRTVCL